MSAQEGPEAKTQRRWQGQRRQRPPANAAQSGAPGSPKVAGAKTASADRFQASNLKNDPVAQNFNQGRAQMGELLRSWFGLNGWTYENIIAIVQEFSKELPLLHGSQLSNLMSGKLEPKPRLFVGLGYLNQACGFPSAERAKYPDKVVKSLIGVRTIQFSQGEIWTAGDFLNFFCGLNPLPMGWIDSRNLRPETVHDCCQRLSLLTRRLSIAKQEDFMSSLISATQSFPPKQQESARQVLGGTIDLSPENFDKQLPLFAEGMGQWLGAIVTPYQLFTRILPSREQPETDIKLLEAFVNQESTMSYTLKGHTIGLDFPVSDEENQAAADEYFDVIEEMQAKGDASH